jgi:hypothetical protein
MNNDNFIKPRAISRQADAHIRIEVHKDQRIIHHLQEEKQENMNLMFYNFNDFKNQQRAPPQTQTGKRPVTSGATNSGMRTQNNFYNRKNLVENGKAQPIVGPAVHSGNTNVYDQPHVGYAGDRVPTRER